MKLKAKMIRVAVFSAVCPKCDSDLTSIGDNDGSMDIPIGSDSYCYDCGITYKYPKNTDLSVSLRNKKKHEGSVFLEHLLS